MQSVTLPQALQLIKMMLDQGLGRERVQELFDSGLLADLLKVDPGTVDRDEFRRVIGLKPAERKIGQMRRGEHGFTVPWALGEFEPRRPWRTARYGINSDYPVLANPSGTASMLVRRDFDGDYHAFPEKTEKVSGSWNRMVPVTLHRW